MLFDARVDVTRAVVVTGHYKRPGAEWDCRFPAFQYRLRVRPLDHIGWGEVARGREKRALDVYNDSLQYYGRLQQEGRIERFDLAVLNPTGGDLGGSIMLQGTAEQIDSTRRYVHPAHASGSPAARGSVM